MHVIKDFFNRNITRDINGVIKQGSREKEVIKTELDEYVVTGEVNTHLGLIFSRYSESLNTPTENMGIWISGFFGSGKSHLLKMLGNIFENGEYDGKKVSEYFSEKISDNILLGDIERASSITTDVIAFDIGKVADQNTLNSKDSIVVAFQKKFNEMQGFIRDDLKLADFERFLWREGKYEEFKELYEEESGYNWIEDRKNFAFREADFLEVVESMDLKGFDEDAAERWLERDNDVAVSAETFSELIQEYLDAKGPKHRIVFLVDEVGQYIGENSQLMLNLQAVVEDLGDKLKGRVWIGVTSQQNLVEVLDQKIMKKQDFSKIQGRFKIYPLSSANIDEVIKKRLLDKTNGSKDSLKVFFDDKEIEVKNLITFEKNDVKLKLYDDREEFAETYPFIPYQFNLLQKVFEKVRKMSHSGQHLSQGERSLLNAFQEASFDYIEKGIGALVPFDAFYKSIESFLEDTARRPIIHAKEQLGMGEFDIRVLKLLFLLKGVDVVKTNIDNLASFMVESIDQNRIDLKKDIEKSLKRLEKQHLIQRNGDEFYFLTDDEQDVNREISEIDIDYTKILRNLSDMIFDDIISSNKVRVKDTGNTYSFAKIIDGQRLSTGSDRIAVHIVTPYEDEIRNSLVMASMREKSLFVKLDDSKDYLEELRTFLQVREYAANKGATNPPENILRIIQLKQSEQSTRRARIVEYVESAIKDAEFFAYGKQLDIGSKSPAEMVFSGLEMLANNTFTKAGFVKKHYDEKEVRNVLSYDPSALTIDGTERDLERNQNKEAIKDMEIYMLSLKDRYESITMKKLVDKYSMDPFGWETLDVHGIVAELFLLSKIEMKFDGENIGISDRKKAMDILTKTRASNQEKLVIEIKEPKDEKLIKDTIREAKEMFGSNISLDENNLYESFKKLLRNTENIAKITLSEYRTSAKYPYPGKKELDEYVDILEELIEDSRNEKDMCKAFLDKWDEIDEIKEKAERVLDFFDAAKGKKKIFDDGIRKLEELQLNQYTIGSLKSDSSAKGIEEILGDKNPYSRIKDIPKLIEDLDKKISSKIQDEKENILKTIEDKKQFLAEQFSGDEEMVSEAEAKYGKLAEQVEKEKGIKVFQFVHPINKAEKDIKDGYLFKAERQVRAYEKEVVDVLREKDNVDELLNEASKKFQSLIIELESHDNFEEIKRILSDAGDEKENYINIANGKAPKKERVRFCLKKMSKKNIEKREEVEEYIAALEEKLKKLKEEMLKAVDENKRIDVES